MLKESFVNMVIGFGGDEKKGAMLGSCFGPCKNVMSAT
mgnify:CR=1 FL=1